MATAETDPRSEAIEASLDEAYSMEFQGWIDEHSHDPAHFPEVLQRLVEFTLPAEPWDVSPGRAHPYLADLEVQCWPWNRAAFGFIEAGRPAEAAEIWSALYLCFLSLQAKTHLQYRKGMPLCNIGFAAGKIPGSGRFQGISWLLGLVEDTLVDPLTASGQVNYRNLRSKDGYTVARIDGLISTVRLRCVDERVIPLTPELAIDYWIRGFLGGEIVKSPSRACVESIDSLIADLRSSYPSLPECEVGYRARLEAAWSFVDLSRVIRK